MKNSFAVLPARILYSTELTIEQKLVYAEITSKLDDEGKCIVDHEYLSKVLSGTVEEVEINNIILSLQSVGLIMVRGSAIKPSDPGPIPVSNEAEQQAESDALEFINFWEKVYGVVIPKHEIAINSVLPRLKSFSLDELKLAATNRKAHIDKEEWFNRPENRKFRDKLESILKSDDKVFYWMTVDMSGKTDMLDEELASKFKIDPPDHDIMS